MEDKKMPKGKIELRLTDEEKTLIRVAAAKSGKPINRFIVDLVRELEK